MTEIIRLIERVVREKFTSKIGLIYADIRDLKEDIRDLKQKYFKANKRLKELEAEK